MEVNVDLKTFMERKRKELHRLNDAYSNTLGKAGVETIEGRAKLVDPHTVEVEGKQYTAKYVCIAVGGTPHMIGLPGARPHLCRRHSCRRRGWRRTLQRVCARSSVEHAMTRSLSADESSRAVWCSRC